jgi:hypothetical protein
MAMKILRIEVRDGIFNAFRCVRQTERVTREMIGDIEFVHGMMDTNFAVYEEYSKLSAVLVQ